MSNVVRWDPGKDPNDIADYVVDWSDVLGTDTITTSTFTVPGGSGLTINSQALSGTQAAVVFLAAGNLGDWGVLNRIVTAGGRTLDQTIMLLVKEH